MSKIDPTRLYTALLNTRLQTTNNPLYQVIYNLIGAVASINDETNIIISGGSPIASIIGLPIDLGGSRQVSALLSASLQNIIEWKDRPIYWTLLSSGLTIRAQVEVRANGTTTATPSIYNVTDAVTEVTGVACSATNTDYSGSNQKQTLAISVQSVKKVYRMQIKASDAVKGVFGNGYIEIVPTGL